MKKVLIIMAERTGTGHKSSANAIEKQLNKIGDYEVKQLDVFYQMGKIGVKLENSYIPVTTRMPFLFYLGFRISQICPNILHFLMYELLRKNLKRILDDYKPDYLITVHSMFTKSISKLLEKEKINIPYYVVVVDLVNPPNVWFDKRASHIFVPTEDTKCKYVEKGIDDNKVTVYGFPVRDDIVVRKEPKSINDKINILMVNPSVKLGKNIKFIKEISRIKNVEISFICGRDERLYKTLIKKQKVGKISKDVHVYDFVKNMNEFLDNSHILLTKAGPNMINEAVRSGTVVVVTGHIRGQENNNYRFVVDNNFGIKCENPNKIFDELNGLINSSKLETCLKSVVQYDYKNGAEIVAKYINKQGKGN